MAQTAKNKQVVGYLPDETPSPGKLIIFALQQVLVMFPATVTVALLTGFHISTTIFASGVATICFLLVTKGKIPLYYGSSFSYIAAIVSITGVKTIGEIAPDALISQAQFGIMCSGLISIIAGLIVSRFGLKSIEKVLPPTVTGSIAIVIGLSLAGSALTGAGQDSITNAITWQAWTAALITLVATVAFSVYLKGVLGQLPILFGIIVGYLVAIPLGLVDFSIIMADGIVGVPHFTLPTPNWSSVIAIMPIAIATIPESTAHIFQLDIYVNNLSKQKGKKQYKISEKLGLNLIGDGIGDIVSAAIGGPAGTNYGENISAMAITKNFSTKMLGVAAIFAMVISFLNPLTNAIRTVPSSVINGACIYLFGVIAAQGISIMLNKKTDLFDARNLAVIAVILIIGLGGHYGWADNMIPISETIKLPSIATAAVVGIVFNLLLSIGRKEEAATS